MKRSKIQIPLLVLISVIAVLYGWAFMAGMGAERTMLNTAYYQGLLETTNISSFALQKIQGDLQNKLPEEMPEEARVLILESFVQAFHTQWLDEQFLLVIHDALPWFKGKQATLTAVIDLRDGKERFKNELLQAMENKAATAEQPPETAEPERIAPMVEEMMGEMPDQLHLVELVEEAMTPAAEETISRLQRYRSYFLITPYVVFTALLLSYLLLAGVPGGLKWFGTTTLITGLTFWAGLHLAQSLFILPLITGGQEIPVAPEILLSAAKFTVAKLATIPLIYTMVGLALLTAGLLRHKIIIIK